MNRKIVIVMSIVIFILLLPATLILSIVYYLGMIFYPDFKYTLLEFKNIEDMKDVHVDNTETDYLSGTEVGGEYEYFRR